MGAAVPWALLLTLALATAALPSAARGAAAARRDVTSRRARGAFAADTYMAPTATPFAVTSITFGEVTGASRYSNILYENLEQLWPALGREAFACGLR